MTHPLGIRLRVGGNVYRAQASYDADTSLWSAVVDELPDVRSQGESLGELAENLKEAIELLLEEPGQGYLSGLAEGQND